MRDFIYHCPTRMIFGRGVVDHTGEELAAAGFSNVLIVTGQGSAERSGTLDRVRASLSAVGLSFVHLPGVRPNPGINLVREGIALARSAGSDIVLGVGGGSVIDTAKAIALSASYHGDPWDLFTKVAHPNAEGRLAIASVLTIPAAGSEASASCVITNDELGLKRGLSSELNRPEIAFLDPELTFTLPAYQTAAGITDMIAHILERFFSSAPATNTTDHIAAALITSLIEEAPKALSNSQDYDARANIMWAGTLAHNDLAGLGRRLNPQGRAGGWESHALAHELSAYDPAITHGAALAVVMPAWMRHVYRTQPERFVELGRLVFGFQAPATGEELHLAERAISALEEFFASIGMPRSLTEFGLTSDCIPELLRTLEQNKGTSFGELVPLTLNDAAAIYRSAL